MTEKAYAAAVTQAERELASLQRERQQLDVRVARLEQTLAGLRSLVDPKATSALGLTDTIRQVLRASPTALRATEIRDQVLAMGTSLGGHSNPMASVHAILTRLLNSHEAMEVEDSHGGTCFWWTLNGPPQFTMGSVLPRSGMSRVLRDSQARRRKLLGKDE